MKYEVLIENYHNFSRGKFEANSDEQAKEIANRVWQFGWCGDNDRLWRVNEEYVDAERLKMEKRYIRII